MRSIYTLVSHAISDLPYLKPAVALVLGFVGGKMFAEFFHYDIGVGTSLSVVSDDVCSRDLLLLTCVSLGCFLLSVPLCFLNSLVGRCSSVQRSHFKPAERGSWRNSEKTGSNLLGVLEAGYVAVV